MADISSKIHEIYSLEQLSGQRSIVHDRHPFVKLVSAFVYIISVISFDRTELGRLIPYIFYPFILMALSGTPWTPVLKRVAYALPFSLIAGLSNIVFDREAAFLIGGITISFGVISFFSILYRTFLCVTAVLLLVAVTPVSELSDQLRRLRIPDIFVTLFEMTYRYVGTLLGEASTMYTAYMLRSTEHKGLQMKHMGSFVGQLLIRSFDRAERVYSAMKCRGYPQSIHMKRKRPLSPSDYIYLLTACLPFALLRVFDVQSLLYKLFT